MDNEKECVLETQGDYHHIKDDLGDGSKNTSQRVTAWSLKSFRQTFPKISKPLGDPLPDSWVIVFEDEIVANNEYGMWRVLEANM